MFDGRPNNAKKQTVGNDPLLNKSQIGENVGLSEHQIKTANRLSNIPEDQFNNQIESNQVPTLTELSEQGTKKVDYLYQPKPKGFAEAIHFTCMLTELHHVIKKHSPELIIEGMNESDKKEVSDKIASLESWFDKFMVKL